MVRSEQIAKYKEVGFFSLVTVLVGKQYSLLTHPLFDYSQWLHNIFRSEFSLLESILRHVALEESSQNSKTLGELKKKIFHLLASC